MSNLKDDLMPDEKVVLMAPLHPIVLLPLVLGLNLLLAAVLLALTTGARLNSLLYSLLAGLVSTMWLLFSALLLLNAVFLALQALALRRTKGLAITNRRLIASCGILLPRKLDLSLDQVKSVKLSQSLLGRLFNFGALTVTSAGGSRATFMPIHDPQVVQLKLSQIIEYCSNARVFTK